MNRLNIYVLKQLITPLFATFFIIIFVFLMQFVWMFVDDLVGKGLPTIVVLEFFYYAILRLVIQSLPLTILLSSIMTFGNLGEKLELLSMKAAGISLMKIMRPMIYLVATITIGAFFFYNDVETVATKKLATMRYDIGRKKPEMNLKEKVFNYDIPGMAIKIDSKNEESGMLYGLMIYSHEGEAGNDNVTLADSGRIGNSDIGQGMALTLYSGNSYKELKESNKKYDKDKVPYRRDTFAMQVVMFNRENDLKRSDASIYDRLWFAKRLSQLKESSDSLKKEYMVSAEHTSSAYLNGDYKISYPLGKKDTFDIMKDTLGIIKADSLFLSQNITAQQEIMKSAKTYVESMKTKTHQKKSIYESNWYNIRKHEAEMHKRFTIPLSCLIFFFIGAPLGAIIRKGGFGMPVIISIILFVIWYIINTFGFKMATEGISPIWVGAWLSTVIMAIMGGFLTYQAATDSVLMSTDNYSKVMKKIFSFSWLKKKKAKN